MTVDKSLTDKVVAFVVREGGITVDETLNSVDLLGDAGLDGSDAEEFVWKFASEFAVDMKDFDGSKYYGPEAGFAPLAPLFPQWWKKRARVERITVKYLVEVATKRRWV